MPGLLKLVLMIAVGVAAWFGYRYFKRWQAAGGKLPTVRRAGQTASNDLEEMVQCRICGTYVTAARPSACGRADCPYRR